MLKATDSVKGKTKEYIKKYMGKFEGPYQRKEDEQDYGSILNKLWAHKLLFCQIFL